MIIKPTSLKLKINQRKWKFIRILRLSLFTISTIINSVSVETNTFISELEVPYVCVHMCVYQRRSQGCCVVRACPRLFRRAQSEASQRKPRTRFTAPGLDEAKVLFGLKQPFPHCLSSRWRCHFLKPRLALSFCHHRSHKPVLGRIN